LLDLGRPIKRSDLTGFVEWKEHQASKQSKSQSPQEFSTEINTEDSTPEDLIEAGVKLRNLWTRGFERQQRAGKSAFARELPLIPLSEGFWSPFQPLWADFRG